MGKRDDKKRKPESSNTARSRYRTNRPDLSKKARNICRSSGPEQMDAWINLRFKHSRNPARVRRLNDGIKSRESVLKKIAVQEKDRYEFRKYKKVN